jgi:hypothetical protein
LLSKHSTTWPTSPAPNKIFPKGFQMKYKAILHTTYRHRIDRKWKIPFFSFVWSLRGQKWWDLFFLQYWSLNSGPYTLSHSISPFL